MSNQKLVFVLGGLAAVLAVVIAVLLLSGGDRDRPDFEDPDRDRAGLELTVTDLEALEPDQALRCFVGGQFVGTATLADCARRNGVDPNGGLDVGLDASGELTAVPFTAPPELPPLDEALVEPQPIEAPATAAPVRQPASGPRCLRHVGGAWRDVGAASLNDCVQTLYAGRCEQLGGASNGRWGETTLSLVPGRVEQSGDNSNFRSLTEQRRDCSIPEVR